MKTKDHEAPAAPSKAAEKLPKAEKAPEPPPPEPTPMAKLAGQASIDPRARVTVVDEKNGHHNYVSEEAAMAAWGHKADRMEYVDFTPATVKFVIRPVPPPPR